MTAIHFILNLVGLLLWMKWTGVGEPPRPGAGTGIQYPQRPPARPDYILRLLWLAALALLIGGRGFIYWQVGSAANWMPTVSLGAIQLTFRTDIPGRVLLFSFVGFLQTLGYYYLFLLLVSATVPRGINESPILRLVRQQLWRIDRLPSWAKLILPLPVIVSLWLAFTPLLAGVHLLAARDPAMVTMLQGLVLGFSACLAWAYAIGIVLLLYLLNSYIYFGAHPFWIFVQEFGGRLAGALAALPLKLRKADFAPVVGIGLMWCVVRYIPPLLTAAFRKLH